MPEFFFFKKNEFYLLPVNSDEEESELSGAQQGKYINGFVI